MVALLIANSYLQDEKWCNSFTLSISCKSIFHFTAEMKNDRSVLVHHRLFHLYTFLKLHHQRSVDF